MTQPNPSGEYSVRSLAEILREHGLESELGTRPGRRRKSSDDTGATGRSARVDTGSGQPRAESPGRSPSAAPNGRAATPPRSPARAPERAASVPVWTPAPEPTARPAAGLLSPQPPAAAPSAAPAPARPAAGPADAAAPPAVRPGRRKSDATPTGPGGEPLFGTGPSTAAIPAASPTTAHTAAPTTAKPTSSTGATARGATGAARRGTDHPVTGPIPVVSPAQAEAARGAAAKADEEPLTGRESVLAWARFAGEMVVALAAGIGVYFAFTVLWELLPYVALVAAPVTVTGLVAGVAAYRQRRGQGALPVRLLAVLLLAGTVLVIAPAAGLLASS
ncbi:MULTISPECIES: hypothetical protein [unclassified Modestobacter]|uniref:hypothetical protein n=1 Tax=unclassified Modestobacter TaxID=2643866 RepID=UPI0022AA54F6|nr:MULTISPECIES: hypothetical protein [unclassified Modestobacter]MCZ2823535.1 hypothetical protein [Modestobacter sp. VKM Ac-2981]MCZ2851780.1 hypothetical protein [Modestobacter sp. VKM Ac-2982]